MSERDEVRNYFIEQASNDVISFLLLLVSYQITSYSMIVLIFLQKIKKK